MKISKRILNTTSDFPVLSRNRSTDENNPFNEEMDAVKPFFLC